MTDSISMKAYVPNVYYPSRTANDYCRDIAEFLSTNPDAWTQGVSARGGDGYPLSAQSPFARKFCALGLLEKFMDSDHTRQIAMQLLTQTLTRRTGGFVPIHRYNDDSSRRVEDIVSLFAEAAALPTGMPLDPDHYMAMADTYYAALKPGKIAPPAKWYAMMGGLTNAIVKVFEAEEAKQAELTAKLVPWETIERQIRSSVAA